MKYVTRYLNYPKKIRLFFKIELQKQYEMDLYNLFTFTSLVNQKIHYTLWKKKKKNKWIVTQRDNFTVRLVK